MSVTADQSGNDPSGILGAYRQVILDAMAGLPAEQRAVIRHSYYDSWPIAQIADELHVDEKTVTARLHYGMRALLLSLEERGLAHLWGLGPTTPSPRSRQEPDVSGCHGDNLQDHR